MGRAARKGSGGAALRERNPRDKENALLRDGLGDYDSLQSELELLPDSLQFIARSLRPDAKQYVLRWHNALEWLRRETSNPATENLWNYLRVQNGPEPWEENFVLGDIDRIKTQMRVMEGVRAVLGNPELRQVAKPFLENEEEIRQEAALGEVPDSPILLAPSREWVDPYLGEGDRTVGYAMVTNQGGYCHVFPETCKREASKEAQKFFRHVLTHELVHTGQHPDWAARNNLDGMIEQQREVFRGRSERQEDLQFALHEALTEGLHLMRTQRDDFCQKHNPAYWSQVDALRQVLERCGRAEDEQFWIRLQTSPPDVAVFLLDKELKESGRPFFDHWLEVAPPMYYEE